MPRGFTLLVGLNRVDPVGYGGWDGSGGCCGCELDVVNVGRLLRPVGYSVVELVTAGATADRIIRAVNRRDHGELIRLLQRAESWLVIEQVAPRLLGRMPIMTLHDAIFSQRRDVREVADGFREVSEELGFEMGLKAEG